MLTWLWLTGAASNLKAEVLTENKEMRKDLWERLVKIEDSLKDMTKQLRGCDKRLEEAEQRVSDAEDRGA